MNEKQTVVAQPAPTPANLTVRSDVPQVQTSVDVLKLSGEMREIPLVNGRIDTSKLKSVVAFEPSVEHAAIWKVAKGITFLGENLGIAARQAYAEAANIPVDAVKEEDTLSECCSALTKYLQAVGVPKEFNLVDIIFVLSTWHIRHVIGVKKYELNNNTKVLIQAVLGCMNSMPLKDTEGNLLMELKDD